jgi:hypothetical protein
LGMINRTLGASWQGIFKPLPKWKK